MPSEMRHITFLQTEVVDAVKGYHHRSGAPWPANPIVQCGPDSGGVDGGVRFRFTFAPEAGDTIPPRLSNAAPEVVIEGPPLAAALLYYCRGRGIPLPAKGEKSLRLTDGKVCLVVMITEPPDRVVTENLPARGQRPFSQKRNV
jgi:hypothetical protein